MQKLIHVVLCFVLVFSFVSCSKKDESKAGSVQNVKDREAPPRIEPEILRVELGPSAPTSSDSIRAVAVLADPSMKRTKYTYQWFVNGEEITELGPDDDTLTNDYFRKKDRVYCRIKAQRSKYESPMVKSEDVEIKNSPPVVYRSPIPYFPIPGHFNHTIRAKDPDDDPVTFRLTGPLNLGIQMDPETGEINWEITSVPGGGEDYTPASASEESGLAKETAQKTAPKIPSFVNIRFEVSDSDGATVSSSIRLDLSPNRGRPK